MVLNRSSHNLRSRGSSTIYEHNKRVFLAAITVRGHIAFLRRRPSMVRNNQLPFTQELVGNPHSFIQKPARILPQIKDQPLQIAHLLQCIRHFVFRSLIESGNVHVPDPGMNHEVQINAVARDFVADD